ncbi:MAG: GtrA family protein [Ktedonobacteraceae bacterium]|nr:GtrA family protein [Ktedonobacteraceae bacterium]
MKGTQALGESSSKIQAADVHQSHAWSSACWQFLRFCLVGGANTAIDLLTLNALLWCLPTNNVLVLVLYNSVAYASGAFSSFFLNKYWTFGRGRRTTSREVVRFVISLFLEILYSNALVWLAGEALHPLIANATLWGNASKLLAVAGSAVISYSCMRFWTFASGSQNQPKRRETIYQAATRPATMPTSATAQHAHHHVESERTP